MYGYDEEEVYVVVPRWLSERPAWAEFLVAGLPRENS
jgi:hypothetical protein